MVLRLTLVEALPGKGVEPLQACAHSPLKAACLPIPPPGRGRMRFYPDQPVSMGRATDFGTPTPALGCSHGAREAPLAPLFAPPAWQPRACNKRRNPASLWWDPVANRVAG